MVHFPKDKLKELINELEFEQIARNTNIIKKILLQEPTKVIRVYRKKCQPKGCEIQSVGTFIFI